MKDKTFGRLALIPLLFFLLAFEVYPVLRTVEYSFFDQDIYSQKRLFVGLENIRRVLEDPSFWQVFKNSLVFTFGSVLIQVVIGVLIALMLNQVFFARDFMRSLMLFSYVIPTVVAVVVWRFMLSDKTGILNHIITTYKLPLPAYWFSSTKTAMMGVIVITVWKFFPFMVLMFLAQLQSIDQEQYEAARIDGATPLQEFRFITLPFLKPVIYIAMMLRTIFTFRNFDIIKLLTNGGPLNATVTMPLQIYDRTFAEFSLGMGSATALVLFVIILAMSFGYLGLYSSAQKELAGQ